MMASYISWDTLVFAQDVDELQKNLQGWYYYITFPSGDGKTFYVLNNDKGEQFSRLVVYNLNHDSFSESLLFSVDVNGQVEWEDLEPKKTSAGKFQRSYNDFSKGTVTFTLTSDSEMTEGRRADLRDALLRRMDALGMPYAIGWGKSSNKELIAVKTLPDHSLPRSLHPADSPAAKRAPRRRPHRARRPSPCP